MSVGTFTVQFAGEIPEGLSVGDVLDVSGRATVHRITADLVDIRQMSDTAPVFTLGRIEVELTANKFDVEAPA